MRKDIKVIQIVKGFPPEDNAGVPQHVFRLASQLSGNIESVVICGNIDNKPDYSFKVLEMHRIRGKTLKSLCPSYFRKFELYLFQKHCHKMIENLLCTKEPFILHGHTWNFGGKQAISCASRFKLPVVITLHGMELDIFSKDNPPAWISELLKADKLIVQKKEALTKLIYWGFSKKDIQISIGPIDTEHFSLQKVSDKLCPTIAFVGRLDEIKRPMLLVQILPKLLKSLPDLQILVGGNGPLLKQMQELSRHLGVEKNITFLGWIRDPLEIYRKSHLFLALSKDHNSSDLSLLEAMSCGVVPVVTASPGIEEIISDYDNGIIASPDGRDLIDKIIWLFSHSTERRIIGTKARNTVLHKASLSVVLRKHQILYSELAETGDVPRAH